MSLTNQEIDTVSNSSFILECVEIRLTQNVSVNPICYVGAGSICQQANGGLKLKIYYAYKSENEVYSHFDRYVNPEIIPGKLLPPGQYFTLVAQDMKGREWIAENIYVPNGGFSVPSVGKVIHANIISISHTSDRHPNEDLFTTYVKARIQGKYRLPFNEREKIEATFSTSSFLNICRIKLNEQEYLIHQRDSYIELSVQSSIAIDDIDMRFKVFLEALGICVGHYLRPSYQSIAINNKRVTTIYSTQNVTNPEYLPPPIPTVPFHSDELETFVNLYTRAFSTPFSNYFGYWYRILKSSSGEIENRILVITTAIEGILKQHYSAYGLPDDDFTKQLDQALPLIASLAIGKRVKDRILTTLGQAQSITATNILNNLAKDRVIPEQMVKVWKSARNRATHADSLKLNDSDMQRYLDQTYICLAIFYRLMLKSLGYKGKIIDYSKCNWPTQSN